MDGCISLEWRNKTYDGPYDDRYGDDGHAFEERWLDALLVHLIQGLDTDLDGAPSQGWFKTSGLEDGLGCGLGGWFMKG